MTKTGSPARASRSRDNGKTTPRKEASSPQTSIQRLYELAKDPKLAKLVAGNPSSPAELLMELSHSDERPVRKACASNPHTPVDALLRLGWQFPEQLMENPVFDLLLLAHRDLFDSLPVSTLNSLLKRDNAPEQLIRWAWENHGKGATLHSLLMNPKTPADIVEALRKSNDQEIRLAAEVHCSQDEPEWAVDIKKQADLERHHLFRHQLAFEVKEKWAKIANDLLKLGDTELRKRCLSLIPYKFRMHYIKDRGYGVSMDIADSGSKSPELLVLLARDPDNHVRMEVASDKHTPVEVLTMLAMDRFVMVRRRVASNGRTPAKLLSQLAMDRDSGVRWQVARNRHTKPDVLAMLADDRVYDVRREVAANSNTPTDVASELRDFFLDQICSEGCKGMQPSSVRRFLLTLPQCPPSILARNFRSRSWLERFAIAGNPSTPESVLVRMSREGNQLVRRAAVKNLACRRSAQKSPDQTEAPSAT